MSMDAGPYSQIPVPELYAVALEGRRDEDLFQRLSLVFVVPGALFLPLAKNQRVKINDAYLYQDDTGVRAKTPGYGHVTGNDVNFFPMLKPNEAETKLWGVLPDKKYTKEFLTEHLLRQWIMELGIKLPILDENLAMAIQAYQKGGGRVPLVEGKDPVHGRPEVVTLAVDPTARIGAVDASGKIDYKERDFVHNVSIGEHLADWAPSIEAWPGRDLFDRPLKARQERPDTYKLGEGLAVDKETGKVVATAEGVLLIGADKTISVGTQQVIAGDVDLSSGNLNAMGSVVIEGSVTPGFTVIAKGDVTVKGQAQDCVIRCGGTLTVVGGVGGSSLTTIEAGGELHAGFISNAHVRVQGDIHVQQYVISSEVFSNGHIYVRTDKKGKVFGCTLTARKGIDVYEAGNPKGVKTVLVTGVDHDAERAIKEIRDKLNGTNERLAKLKAALGNQYFVDPKSFLARLPKNKIEFVKQTLGDLRKTIEEHKALEAEFAKFNGVQVRDKSAVIIIRNQGYEGIVLTIANYTAIPPRVSTPTRFICEGINLVPTVIEGDGGKG